MAPADMDLSQTRQWLAKLHTTNPPPPASNVSNSSSSSSTHSRGSADYSPGASLSPTSSSTSDDAPTSPLTESRARSLQRLCELGDAHTEPVPAEIVNARLAPSNMNYIKTTALGDGGAGEKSVPVVSPREAGRSRWSRKSSEQSLEALEGDSVRRFSLSRFKLRW
ncbi:hypothetical protein A9K55_002517 [Cordyceps militaris]|uniref:Uncharacterized protein n=1 Tax=Cordyceps militaris TaxID=73501 RepID=A0A2H4S8S1_CORMI|nr:hypothetical protein A9K55_002517 [Cordyceps militaris]